MRDSGVRSPPPTTQRMVETSNDARSGCASTEPKHDRRKPSAGELLGSDRGEHALDVEVAMDIEHSADPQHGHAGQVECADVVQWAGHQQTRVGV